MEQFDITTITEQQIVHDSGAPAVQRLYEEAFPAEEQIPWGDLLWLVPRMPLDFTSYYAGDTLLGMTIVYPRPSFNWFWYFAVCNTLRGRGIGQQLLTRVLDKYRDRSMILDMESPEQICDNAEQRRRRHAFYLRNGFRDTGVGRSYAGVDYTIMMRGAGTFDMSDYDTILAELHRHWNF